MKYQKNMLNIAVCVHATSTDILHVLTNGIKEQFTILFQPISRGELCVQKEKENSEMVTFTVTTETLIIPNIKENFILNTSHYNYFVLTA